MSQAAPADDSRSIAIVGMSGRFPEAPTVARLWQGLVAGATSIRMFSDEELRAAGVPAALIQQPNYIKAGTLIADIDRFDAEFFGYSAREAELMDPQHRLFLECCWEALEDGACNPETFRSPIGVFAGSGFPTYLTYNVGTHPDLVQAAGELQLAVGNERDSLASTVSYKLNLRGPSVAVQTFCSTSLVAVHLACQSLLTYECGLALAGGVAIPVPQGVGYRYEEGGIVSPDGLCRAFDAAGQGSVMGSGLGVVALKRLKNALADGDQIYAVIKGSAVNNDGSAKVGYTAPGTSGQANVIALALRRANVAPETIGYIETHGTGTPLGDSIELAAMIKAFGKSSAKQFCAIGSVKPNIGHLDRASGVTGLIKAALALQHNQIPPSLNFERPNPEIDLAGSPFFVNTALRPWPHSGGPRRAGVSSFGLGGTNAHVILEQAPPRPAPAPARPQQLLLLSAKTPAALDAMSANLAAHLRAHPEQALADVAYTLQVGRATFNHRRALVASSREEALALLEAPAAPAARTEHSTYRDRPVMLIFPDDAEHAPGATRALYQHEPAFRAAIDRCAEILRPHLGLDLRQVLYPDQPPTADDPSRSDADMALLALEYALAQVLIQSGLQPQGLLGRGAGEYVAACVAGVLPLEQALELALLRRRALDPAEPAAQAALLACVRRLTPRPPQIPLVVQRTGVWLSPEQAADPAFWSHYDWSPARFGEGLATLRQEASALLLEVAPAPQVARTEPDLRSLLPDDPALPGASARLLASLAGLWLAGARIGWEGLSAGEHRQRVALPTYPFERRRYWVERQDLPAQTGTAPADPGKRPDIADWFYLPAWRQSLAAPADPAAPRPEHWLILADDAGLAEQLAERLRARQIAVSLARPGAAFAQLGPHDYTLDPTSPADYRQLLRALPQPPGGVLHLWSLGPPQGSQLDAALFDQAQQRGLWSLVHLVRALGRQIATTSPELWVVSQQSWRVTGGEALCPEHATLAGACTVVAQENLDMRCYQLDIERPAAGSWQQRRLVEQILAELANPGAALAVALRAGERWTRAYEPLRLPEQPSVLRQRGVYLITGGLGNVGLVLAAHLAQTYQARLVLTAHGPFPPAERWDEWLAERGEADPTSQRIRALQSCRAAGGEVLVLSVDVADQAQLRAALDAAEQHFGALHGLVYAAGTGAERSFGTVQDLDLASGALHFRTKAHGLIALEQALAGRELDFCLVFSSLASVLGGLGFVAYSAANSFVDAFVQRHNQTDPQRWTAVNWDTWDIKDNPHGDLGATVLDFAMRRAEALQAFERAAASAATQLVNSTGDLEARLDQWVRMVAFRARAAQPAQLHPRPSLLTPYEPPSNETEQIITEIWQQVLGVEVGIHDHFLELGGNSLIGTQVVTRLRRAFQCSIPLTILFDAPTIAEMATAVELVLIDEISQLDQEALLRLSET